MKVFWIVCVFSFCVIRFYGQHTNYLSLKIHGGSSTLHYDFEDGKRKSGHGRGHELQYRFYLYDVIGIGVGVSYLNSKTTLAYDYYQIDNGMALDSEGVPYESILELLEVTETQDFSYISIPVLIAYKHRFPYVEDWQLYFEGGISYIYPIKSDHLVTSGVVKNSGFYEEYDDLLMESVPHRFDVESDESTLGHANLRNGISLSFSIGATRTINDRLEAFAGLHIDRNITNMKKESFPLVSLDDALKMQAYSENLGDFSPKYAGVLNSVEVSDIKYGFHGIEIGLRYRLQPRMKKPFKEKNPIKEPKPKPIKPIAKDSTVEKDLVVEKDSVEDDYAEAVEVMKRLRSKSAHEGLVAFNEYEVEVDSSLLDIMSGIELEILYFVIENYPMAGTSFSDDQMYIFNTKYEIMKKYEDVEITVIGHTCSTGSERINYQIGLMRAHEAKREFILRGIHRDRIKTFTMGETSPRYPNISERAMALNRRITIEIRLQRRADE